MLQLKLKEVLDATARKYPYRWMMSYFGFSKNKCYQYLNNKQNAIDLRDFSKLCEGLRCTPNDLLYWEQTENMQLDPQHPIMVELHRPSERSEWYKLLNTLGPDKLAKLHKKIDNGEINLED